MKKLFIVLTISVLMISSMSLTAFAHGGHGGRHSSAARPRYEICTVTDCTKTGLHEHDGIMYCVRLDYSVCEEPGCTKTGLHRHDGSYYCHNQESGHGHNHSHGRG